MVSKREETKAKKVELLKFMLTKKAKLFGKFSSELENKEKKEAWTEVLIKAKSLELASDKRDTDFVRDSLWGIWRNRTLTKKDNKGKTGSKGGKENVLDDVDHLVLEIIGKDSPAIKGLPVPETGLAVVVPEPEKENIDPSPLSAGTSNLISTPRFPQRRQPLQKRRVFPSFNSVEQDKKAKLQNDLLELTIYKTRLECRDLEQKLLLPKSTYTCILYEEKE